jgi:hypothetical protein
MVNGEINWKLHHFDGRIESESMLAEKMDIDTQQEERSSQSGALLTNVVCLPTALNTIPAKRSTNIKDFQV